MQEDSVYIILFPDLTFQAYNVKQDLKHFQQGARQFKTADSTPVIALVECAARAWKNLPHYITEAE